MNSRRFKGRLLLYSLPGFIGFLMFYLIPFGKSIWYSLIDNVYQQGFVGLDNYLTVFQNEYFQMALKNTLSFSFFGVASMLVLSFAISMGISAAISKGGEKLSKIKNLFLLPMLLPSASVIFTWQMFFDQSMYNEWMKSENPLIEILPMYLLYLWKYSGINIVLITAAITQIEEQVLEAARLEGVKGWQQYRYIIIPLSKPTLFFVGILSLVNTLKIFKESYLFYGTSYPPDGVYSIQYYMNNHFYKLNYNYLSSASVVVALILGTLIFVTYHRINKAMKDVNG